MTQLHTLKEKGSWAHVKQSVLDVCKGGYKSGREKSAVIAVEVLKKESIKEKW